MAEVTPLPAASVILLRDDPFEVLMIRRHEKRSFAPDVWAFPGGAVEESDRHGDLLNSMRLAAARELREETGISLGEPLDLEKLVWTSHWITPEGLPKRFDTYFFLAVVPRGASITASASGRAMARCCLDRVMPNLLSCGGTRNIAAFEPHS